MGPSDLRSLSSAALAFISCEKRDPAGVQRAGAQLLVHGPPSLSPREWDCGKRQAGGVLNGMTASCAVPFTDAEEVPPAGGAGREGQAPAGGPANAEPASEPQVSRAAGPAGGRGGFAPHPAGQIGLTFVSGPSCTRGPSPCVWEESLPSRDGECDRVHEASWLSH